MESSISSQLGRRTRFCHIQFGIIYQLSALRCWDLDITLSVKIWNLLSVVSKDVEIKTWLWQLKLILESSVRSQWGCWDQNTILSLKIWNHLSVVTKDVEIKTLFCQVKIRNHLSVVNKDVDNSKHHFVSWNLESSITCQWGCWDQNMVLSLKIWSHLSVVTKDFRSNRDFVK